MRPTPTEQPDRTRVPIEAHERGRSSRLELFFDLVFVLGFRRCTALVVAEPTAPGMFRGLLALALLWWAWTGYTRLASLIEPEERAVRLVVFAATALGGGRAVPAGGLRRPGLRGTVTYGGVRASPVALYLLASGATTRCIARSSRSP